MIVVTGLSVTLLILSSIACPHPASFVSTSVTPPSVTNTDTLPPLNVSLLPGVELSSTQRLSRSFCISMTRGACAGACDAAAAIENAPAASTIPSTIVRFIDSFPVRRSLSKGGSIGGRVARFPLDVAADARLLIGGDGAPLEDRVRRGAKIGAGNRRVLARAAVIELSSIHETPITPEQKQVGRAGRVEGLGDLLAGVVE